MKYRKRPVVVEAEQLTQERIEAYVLDGVPLPEGVVCTASNYHKADRRVQSAVTGVRTLEGFMLAEPGDWIITGVKGERYPCKPDIFHLTYEPADEAPRTTSAPPKVTP